MGWSYSAGRKAVDRVKVFERQDAASMSSSPASRRPTMVGDKKLTDLPWPIDEGSTHWEGCFRERRHHNCAVVEVDRLRAENERLRNLVDRLKLEAQMHAGEARCQTATVHECYQAASGARGERRSWHGATPVREALDAKTATIERLRGALEDAEYGLRSAAWVLSESVVADPVSHLIPIRDKTIARANAARDALEATDG